MSFRSSVGGFVEFECVCVIFFIRSSSSGGSNKKTTKRTRGRTCILWCHTIKCVWSVCACGCNVDEEKWNCRSGRSSRIIIWEGVKNHKPPLVCSKHNFMENLKKYCDKEYYKLPKRFFMKSYIIKVWNLIS